MEAAETAIGYDSINVRSPYPILNIQDLQITRKVNQHGKLYCTGLIDSDHAEDLVENTGSHEAIEIVRKTEDGACQTLFQGVITEVGIKTVRGNYYITIEALSYTFDLDVKLQSASFQNLQLTYTQLIDKVLEGFKGADCNDQVTNGANLDELIIRYQETAWDFLKRIASRFGTVLIPDSTQAGPKFWMGLPPGKERAVNDFHYTVVKDRDRYLNASSNYDSELNEIDFIGYQVESISYLDIGDYVTFQKKKLRVAQSTAVMKQGILTFNYTLTLDTGVRQNLILNEKLSGMSLPGKVIDREKDTIKVHLDIDQKQPKEEAFPLPYFSRYTAEGHSGWYCLPENGDNVRVYFPNAKETGAMVINSLRQDSETNEKIANPNIKYFGNTFGKELILSDGAVTLSSSGEAFRLSLNLDSEKGILIKSDQELNLQSANDIVFNSNRKFDLKAKDGVYLHCKSSSIILDGKTDIQGNRVIIQKATGSQGAQVEPEAATDKTEAKQESNWNPLDMLQLGLDIAGFIPVVGAVFDVVNAGIYAARGDYASAALSAVAAIPGIGDCAAAAKVGFKAAKTVSSTSKALKVGMKAAKAASAAKAVGSTSKIGKIAKTGMMGYGAIGAAQGLGSAYEKAQAGDWVNAARDALPAIALTVGLGKSLTKSRKIKSGFVQMENPKNDSYQVKNDKPKRSKNRNQQPGTIIANSSKGDPVDAVVGEVTLDQTDFTIPGRFPITWKRHYGSQNSRIGATGRGWESFADIRLELKDQGEVVFYDGTAAPFHFEKLPDLKAIREPIDGGLLQKEGQSYTVRLKGGLTYYFPIPAKPLTEIPVESIKDPSGNTLLFLRDHNGLQEIREEGSDRSLKMLSKNGRIEKVYLAQIFRDSLLLAQYEYDQNHNLTTVFDGMRNPYHFRYRDNLLVQHTNRNRLSFYYEYDKYTSEGKCIHSWGDDGLYDYKFVYNETRRTTTFTDSLGQVGKLVYDDRYLITQEIDPLGGVTNYEYDDAGRTTAVVDPEGRRTEYLYDKRGNLIELTRPDGKSSAIEYNQADRPVQITDPDGAIRRQEWNEQGLLFEEAGPMGAKSHYEYDQYGQPVAFIDPSGARTELAFDNLGNLAEITDPLGKATKFKYNPLGQVITKTDPLGRETEYLYDNKGRLVKVIDPNKNQISCVYDPADNLISYTDENGAITRLEYCGLNELKRRIQPDHKTVEYHYDTEERLIAITNQRGERYELKRDALGRIIEEVDYWGQSRRYDYSPAGNLLESIDPLGRKIQYQTDPLGRILEKLSPDPRDPEKLQKETFSYDTNGNLVECENNAIRIERLFDEEGKLLEERQGKQFVVKYAYDKTGNRISRTTEVKMEGTTKTRTVNYGYDALGLAASVEVPGHEPIRLTRNALGQVVEEQLGLNLKRSFDYSREGYLTHQRVFSNEGILFKQEYKYNRTGNLVQKIDSVFGTDQFNYDPIGRITGQTDPERKYRSYLYDPAGDLLKTQVQSEDEVWSRAGEYEGIRYLFDQVGNLVERTEKQDKTEFVWDANGRLTESVSNGKKTIYKYDPLGRRISKETDGVVTLFYWDGDALLGDVTDDDTREWVYYPGSFEPLVMVRNEEFYLYHNEPNGCPSRLLDESGKVVWAARYDAWGKIKKLIINDVEQPLRLQGQYFDRETGLYYNRFRYYDSGIGAFVSQDPLGLAAGENIYQYAPNAQGWIDPLGLCKEAKYIYDGKSSRYRNTENGRYVSQRNLPYPSNNGFASSSKGVIQKGQIIDRFGPAQGRFAGEPGATISGRGLPPGSEALPYIRYEVIKPLPAEIGPAAPVPEFNAVGGAIQYRFDQPISKLIEAGYLKPIP